MAVSGISWCPPRALGQDVAERAQAPLSGAPFLICSELASEQEMTDGEKTADLLALWWLR